jgi:ferredoxin
MLELDFLAVLPNFYGFFIARRTQPMSVQITFQPDQITVTAEVGEALLSVAERAGVEIPTGCCQGSCGACEVVLEADDPNNPNPQDIRACISAVPPGQPSLIVSLFCDPTW